MDESADLELSAMSTLWSALQSLPDQDAKMRCVNWALARMGVSASPSPVDPKAKGIAPPATPASGGVGTNGLQDTLVDVFERTDDGRIRIIARDLKAKNRNDAAIRLVYLVLYANEVLGKTQKTSSRKFVLPVLTEWRAYDGNTRGAIARDQGIKRDGDFLSLDVHSRREAQNIIQQIRDESTKGSWSPISSKTRKVGAKSKD